MAWMHTRGGIVCGIPDASGETSHNGRTWRWDYLDSPGGGPLFVRENHEPLKNQNPPQAVWRAFQAWLKEYRKAHPL